MTVRAQNVIKAIQDGDDDDAYIALTLYRPNRIHLPRIASIAFEALATRTIG